MYSCTVSVLKTLIFYFVDLFFYRAQAVNTQIGKEEYSAFTRLTVVGQSPSEIAPEIVIKPKDLHIVKGQAAVDLQCIANARYGKMFFYIDFSVILDLFSFS